MCGILNILKFYAHPVNAIQYCILPSRTHATASMLM